MVPDRDEDIRPRFHRSRTHQLEHESSNGGGAAGEASSLETDEDADDGYDEEGSLSDWNLREYTAGIGAGGTNRKGSDSLLQMQRLALFYSSGVASWSSFVTEVL